MSIIAVVVGTLHIVQPQQVPLSFAIESLPKYGTFEDLSGRASGGQLNSMKVLTFIFLPDLGWYQRPGCGGAASLTGAGMWSSDITIGPIDETATKVAAYLVPAAFAPECVQGDEAIPFAIERIALAKDLYERPNPTPRTLQFGGQEWVVKSSRIPVYPGPRTPNFFVEDSRNVFVDPQGRLHLRVTRCGDAWCSSEVYTRARVGYGTYRLQLDSPMDRIDPNVVLGLFTWSEDAVFAHREMDIEFAKWGNAGDRNTAQYVVQPYNQPGHMLRFPVSTPEPTIHTIQWLRGVVGMSSGLRSGALISQWAFPNGALAPPPGDVRFHINFYLNNAVPPVDGQEKEVVLSTFDFSPSGPIVGLDETNRTIGPASGDITVSVSSTDQACAWSLRSSVPWIKIANPSASGSRVATLSVAANAAEARQGQVDLFSDNCNVPFGRQAILFQQGAFQCALSVQSDPLIASARGNRASLFVEASANSCAWSATVSAPWILLRSPANQLGSNYVDLELLGNNTGEAREATLQVGPQLVKVYQDASNAALGAVPNPTPLCETELQGSSGLTWNAAGFDSVDLIAHSVSGAKIGSFSTQGSTIQGGIRRPGESFFLVGVRSTGERKWIASAYVGVRSCVPGQFPMLGLGGLGSSASFQFGPIAPGQLATVYGFNLASFQQAASSVPLPTDLGGTRVMIGGEAAPLVFASSAQVNFLVPESIPVGKQKVVIGQSSGDAIVVPASPGLFTMYTLGGNIPLGSVVTVDSNDVQTSRLLVNCATPAQCTPLPIAFPPGVKDTILILYGTGMRAVTSTAKCMRADQQLDILYLGQQGEFPGLDQLNVRLPHSLRGSGKLLLELTVDGRKSQSVPLLFP